jgi:thermostable 8-oxoguanine DNA glycosylase
MLVILGDVVDTVIQYQQNGGVRMPQLSTYAEVAESAAHADEKLARQRASARRNTTGEGVDWPRDWKLGEARAAGKIWYRASELGPERAPDATCQDEFRAANAYPMKPSANVDPYNFALQFSGSEIEGLVARRLTNVDEKNALEAGRSIAAGNLTRDNLNVIVSWKMEGVHHSRVMSYLGQNKDDAIVHALNSAAKAGTEAEAIETLDRLHGVGIPVASAILTMINPNKYAIIDVYALRSLGIEDGPTDRTEYYIAYLRKCRELAEELRMPLRILDHAMWQWGYEHRR